MKDKTCEIEISFMTEVIIEHRTCQLSSRSWERMREGRMSWGVGEMVRMSEDESGERECLPQ